MLALIIYAIYCKKGLNELIIDGIAKPRYIYLFCGGGQAFSWIARITSPAAILLLDVKSRERSLSDITTEVNRLD